MQIGSSSLYNINTSYTIRLNEKELLVVEEDPFSKTLSKSKKKEHQQELDEKKTQEALKRDNPQELSPDDERLLKELTARDSEVKTHEAAHQALGGGLAGAASYTYQQGPDGKMYAIGGQVSISTPSTSNPEEAIRNAHAVAASAMAAGSPSSQDFNVASSASIMEMKAKQKESNDMQKSNTMQEIQLAYSKDENNSGFDISA
jgi:hypothetical protein